MKERRAIAIRGIVQGVGFRPFVYGLARRLNLAGFVKNQTSGVLIEVEGDVPSLDSFLHALTTQPPPLAQIDHCSWEPRGLCDDEQFRIEHSAADASRHIFISPDVATCADCLAELFDPRDRRFGYPFLNCTNCGPRLTIIKGSPYDRERTTMAGFAMCPACRAEFEDPANRRFHAQPTCCLICGPQLCLTDGKGGRVENDKPLEAFAVALHEGQVGALKGLGGYHLVCVARMESAVAELRRRKHREEKPFAIMVSNTVAASVLCEVAPAEAALLESGRRPIVLLRKQPSCDVAPSVAPGNPYLGIMLPYTPLHHLLMKAMDGAPLVMTSGNRSDEPIAYEDDDALERLGGIADVFLLHNRPIHVRCDDSVTRLVDGAELPVRRSRGYAPFPVRLPISCSRPILAVGGQMKGSFALGRDQLAFLSHHLGDLDHYDAFRAFVRDVDLFQQLFGLTPDVLAHDLHPNYASTGYALKRGGRLIAVQHHHAHMASCMAENGLTGPVIGVSFDGTGYGTDGAVWGGEFLVGDYREFRRAAHFRYVGLPGGDQAVRETWRMAVAHLLDAGLTPRVAGVSQGNLRVIEQMLERRFNTPQTSSMGRLFDTVAALAGLRQRVAFEGQAAMELEWLATETAPDGIYPYDLVETSDAQTPQWIVDTRPLIRSVAEDASRGIDASRIARRFHSTIVEIVSHVCARLCAVTEITRAVLSGGVFLNVLLTTEVCKRLREDGMDVYRHRLVPPNDGGLSLGQLAVAAARMGC